MAEYIERGAVRKLTLAAALAYGREPNQYVSFLDELENIPAADVAEVRHGRWEFLGPNNQNRECMCGTCSVCHVRSKYIVNTAICPNCGALMDGKEAGHENN